MSHLGLDKKYEHPRVIFRTLLIGQIKKRIKELFEPPFYYRLEVGMQSSFDKLPRLHVHIIAEKFAGLPHLSRAGQIVKPIDDFIGMIEYLSKPNLVYSETLASILKEEKYRRVKQGQKRFSPTSDYVWQSKEHQS